jgi:uncharacterized protein GlcG (DUF336 family)
MQRRGTWQARSAVLTFALLASACGGGGGGGGGNVSGFLGGSGDPTVVNMRECDSTCQTMFMSQSQVATVIQQAVNEMQARGIGGATIAVVDRVGNPLAVFEAGTAPASVTIGSNLRTLAFPGNGLEDVPGGAGDPTGVISARLAALSKAGTAAYLSTQGNAFTTRTASQIIQENFNPSEMMQAGGPLFGVQFSQLPCSDFARRAFFLPGADGPSQLMAGPKRLPLGFAGDPGGLPLYIAGDMVGAVGIEINGVYTVDRSTIDVDFDIEEVIALAAQRNFEPDDDREARAITVIGKALRYTDQRQAIQSTLLSALVAPNAVTGATPVDIPGFYLVAAQAGEVDGVDVINGIRRGVRFLVRDSDNLPDAVKNAERGRSGYLSINNYAGFPTGPVRILVRGDDPTMAYLGGNDVDPRGPGGQTALQANGMVQNPRPSVSPLPADGGLTADEVAAIVANGIMVAKISRAQIRNGIGGPGLPFMEVNVSVVDLQGNILGYAGTEDAPVFGTDVSIQKARTAAFLSRGLNGADPDVPQSAADDLIADVELADPVGLGVNFQTQPLGQYVTDIRTFLEDDTALSNGIGFSDRSGGNLSRPFYPDGINGAGPGPFSKALSPPQLSTWSPFNTGLQLDLILDRLLIGLLADPAQFTCTGPTLLEVRGGIQIFPGSVPIYRNGVVIGGIGISGDGVDQDDLVAFEGLKRGSQFLGNPSGIGSGAIPGNAPLALRSDTIAAAQRAPSVAPTDNPYDNPKTGPARNLRYVNCPPSAFLNGDQPSRCEQEG